MKRKGSAAILLIVLIVAGGFYLFQHPEFQAGLNTGGVNDLLSAADRSSIGSTSCSEATSWANSNGYSVSGCVCTYNTRDGTPTVVMDLGSNRYQQVAKYGGGWTEAGQTVHWPNRDPQTLCR